MKIRLLLLALAVFVAANLFAQTAAETRTLTAFEKIAIAGDFDQVTVQEGTEEKVVIEASGVALDKIITEVKNGALNIVLKKGSYHDSKIRIVVTYRKLNEISNSGSTDIVAVSPIRGEQLTFNSSGSGDFTATLDVRKLQINISGSSDLKIGGQADAQAYAISGSGDINASNLSGKSADVAISGSCDVHLNVSGPVKTAISGSGNVENKG